MGLVESGLFFNQCGESTAGNQNSPISLPQLIRARFAPLSPASGFPVSIFPSFQYSIGIKRHPSGVNSMPDPLGPDSLRSP